MIRAALLLVAAGLAVSPDSSTDRDLATALKGRIAGKPARCLLNDRLDERAPEIVSDRILLYHDGQRLWRNDLPAACHGLDRDAIIVSEVRGSDVCENDSFYAVERGVGIPGPRCRLGSFVPWDRVAR